MQNVRHIIRRAAIGLVGLLFAVLVLGPVQEFAIEYWREQGAFDEPTKKVGIMMDLANGIVAASWFPWVAGAILGFTIGVWLDTFLRRKEMPDSDLEEELQKLGVDCVSMAEVWDKRRRAQPNLDSVRITDIQADLYALFLRLKNHKFPTIPDNPPSKRADIAVFCGYIRLIGALLRDRLFDKARVDAPKLIEAIEKSLAANVHPTQPTEAPSIASNEAEIPDQSKHLTLQRLFIIGEKSENGADIRLEARPKNRSMRDIRARVDEWSYTIHDHRRNQKGSANLRDGNILKGNGSTSSITLPKVRIYDCPDSITVSLDFLMVFSENEKGDLIHGMRVQFSGGVQTFMEGQTSFTRRLDPKATITYERISPDGL